VVYTFAGHVRRHVALVLQIGVLSSAGFDSPKAEMSFYSGESTEEDGVCRCCTALMGGCTGLGCTVVL
jgi:hypothetical protein